MPKTDEMDEAVAEFIYLILLSIAIFLLLFFPLYIVHDISTQKPSYLFLNSTMAKLGIKPLDNIGKLNSQDYELVTLCTCPIVYNNELYIPVDFAARASGISRNSIISEGNLLIVNDDRHKTIIINGDRKNVNINGEKTINIPDMLIHNKTIMLPEIYIHDLFGLKIKQCGNTIILY
jgi:hypothetical protein